MYYFLPFQERIPHTECRYSGGHEGVPLSSLRICEIDRGGGGKAIDLAIENNGL